MSAGESVKNLMLSGLGVAAAFFLYFVLTRLIRVKEKWWCKALLHFNCWQACIMIIFVGDIDNLSLKIGRAHV